MPTWEWWAGVVIGLVFSGVVLGMLTNWITRGERLAALEKDVAELKKMIL